MDPQPSDEDIERVRRACQGDPGAYRELYERYKDKVFATVLRIVGNYEEAVDVAQDVFVKVYRDMRTFAFKSKFSTWLYRIAVNFAINRVHERERHSRAHWKLAHDARNLPREPQPPAERIRAAIRSLSPKLRTVVALRYLGDLSYDEIAEVLELSVGTVKSRLHLAHEALRESLGDLIRER